MVNDFPFEGVMGESMPLQKSTNGESWSPWVVKNKQAGWEEAAEKGEKGKELKKRSILRKARRQTKKRASGAGQSTGGGRFLSGPFSHSFLRSKGAHHESDVV